MKPADLFSGSFDPKLMSEIAGRFGHGGALGIHYVDHGEDWVELGIPYQEKLVGVAETGVLASGPIISLMDMAMSMGVWMKLGRFRIQVTLDLRVDYMRPATPGKSIIGRGECYALRRNVAFVRGIAHDGDIADPVATVSGTFIPTSPD